LKKFAQQFSQFIPIAKSKLKLAGLLARPVFCAFPSRLIATVTLIQRPFYGLTAAGAAPEFHRIPFLIHPFR